MTLAGRGVQKPLGESAPAAADFQHAFAAGKFEQLADAVELGVLRLSKRLMPRMKTARPNRTCRHRAKAGRNHCRDRNARRCCAGCRGACCGSWRGEVRGHEPQRSHRRNGSATTPLLRGQGRAAPSGPATSIRRRYSLRRSRCPSRPRGGRAAASRGSTSRGARAGRRCPANVSRSPLGRVDHELAAGEPADKPPQQHGSRTIATELASVEAIVGETAGVMFDDHLARSATEDVIGDDGGGQFRRRRPQAQADALHPEPQRLPVDGGDDLQRQRGIVRKTRRKAAVGRAAGGRRARPRSASAAPAIWRRCRRRGARPGLRCGSRSAGPCRGTARRRTACGSAGAATSPSRSTRMT